MSSAFQTICLMIIAAYCGLKLFRMLGARHGKE